MAGRSGAGRFRRTATSAPPPEIRDILEVGLQDGQGMPMRASQQVCDAKCGTELLWDFRHFLVTVDVRKHT
jgi:hypothetical protein